MLIYLGEPPVKFLWCWLSLFFILLSLFFFSFLLNIIPHPSVDYHRVFKPILYFQPSPWQGDSRHFHLNLSEIFSGHFFTHRQFFTLHSFINILPAFIKASLGAGSSSLKFSGLHTDDPRNTDLSHLFVWFTVFHNLHIQNNSLLNSTKHYHELLVVKVNLSAPYSFQTPFACSKSYVKTIRKHFEQDLLLLKTTSMNIKAQPGAI